MNSTEEEQPREGCSCGGVLFCFGKIRSSPTMVASPIYRGHGPLPKYLSEKGANNDHFEGEHLVQLILTKVGLWLPKALAMMPSWAPRRPLSAVLLVLVLLH